MAKVPLFTMPRGGPDASYFDRLMEPSGLEWLDDPKVSDRLKRFAMSGLDNFNRRSGAYRQFAAETVRQVHPWVTHPRILELGAGHGELSARVARRLRGLGVKAEIVASDISDDFVAAMLENPRLKRLGVKAKRVDATRIAYADRSFDLAVFTQALHHLDPPQVVELLSEGTRVAKRLLVIDGWRHPCLLLTAPALLALGNLGSLHDGLISIRRMYSADAVRHLAARSQAPLHLDVAFLPPGYMRVIAMRE